MELFTVNDITAGLGRHTSSAQRYEDIAKLSTASTPWNLEYFVADAKRAMALFLLAAKVQGPRRWSESCRCFAKVRHYFL
jgi:hypothetical protein